MDFPASAKKHSVASSSPSGANHTAPDSEVRKGQRHSITVLQQRLNSVIRGKEETIDILLISLLAGGSVLMEDVPGVGKTTLAKSLAKALDADFRRVQFTPDLLPSDILGASIYNPADGSFTFKEGPIFCSILLADEINRASPRTQSALLEAMSEGQATIEGVRHRLPHPFLVLATQNPVDFHGTYPLPEAQLDRFLVQLKVGYPDRKMEVEILYDHIHEQPDDEIEPILPVQEVLNLQEEVKKVHVERSTAEYLVEIVARTRSHPHLKLGVSPRGSLMFFRAVQACAFISGRDFATPDDVQRMAGYVLAHRLVMTSKARYGNTNKNDVIDEILKQLPVPT
ncbi:AAA family ATPase [Planctomicrobium sp. SH668]|uniref:AAA family ATPase n=1 Tax=Planctomicrobium sp. SH668 TaxID=3448126 RepID=UPI003F5BF582